MADDIPEDIPEDVPEDSSTDSEDIADDIPEDIPEDVPEDSSTDSEDIADDIPEDIPEDVPEDSSADSDDMADDIPEDIPEDIPTDTLNDAANETSSDETEDSASDVSADEQPTDSQDDMADEALSDETEDSASDVSADEQLTDSQDDIANEASSDETTDSASDVSADEQPTDSQDDIANEASSDETTDSASDISADEQPTDSQDDMADEALLNETEDSASDVSADEQPTDSQDDMTDEALSDETTDSASDVSADEQPTDSQDDMADEASSDETTDSVSDVSADEQPTDSQNDMERNADTQEDAFLQLSDYMNEHNYGPDDFATYSQDPEWQRLHSNAYPDYTPPEASSADTQENSFRQLSEYMNEHNYGPDDFATYSQDPEWQRLHSNAYPDYALPKDSSEGIVDYAPKNISEDTATDTQSDISQSMGTEIAEAAFNQELGREFEDNILSDPELTPEQKELMLEHFNKVNCSDNAETREMQTGNLMSDILKTSQLDDTDSVSDIQESSPFIHAMEISNSVIDRYEKVRNNTALLNDEIGYQIAMNEMSKDLGKQVTDIDLAIAENDESVKVAEEALKNYSSEMELSTLSDSKYRELVENLQNSKDQSNQLRSQKSYLESLKNEASAEVSDEFKGMSFISPIGKPFSDTFSELINEQGAAYPNEIINDCGVCTMGNLANQHGGKYTEKSGLAAGFGEYDYTQITDDMLPDEKIYALKHNGLTSLDSQANILNKMGCEAVKYENGASFDDIVANISKGNSMSLNLYGRDLNSGSDIAKRPGRIAAALSSQQSALPANHAVTIAGLAINPSGKPIGFFVNDTGGYGGKNNPSIFVSKAKYTQMLRRTVGISSIVCTGKKVFV